MNDDINDINDINAGNYWDRVEEEKMPPASEQEIQESEQLLGFNLPQPLKDVYKVANGGFGPAYGVLGIIGGHTDDRGENAVDLYCASKNLGPEDTEDWKVWPDGWLHLHYGGCTCYSVVDCTKKPYPVYTVDFGEWRDKCFQDIIKLESPSLNEWLATHCNVEE